MPDKINLKIDWATHESTLYACKNWHYSKSMPAGKTVKVGVWEDSVFIGAVIYSYGANNNAAKGFGLEQNECCHLTPVALRKHKTPVSRILSISLNFLKKNSPGIKLVFSYADKTNQNHHGGIYQANGWDYLGIRKTADKGAYYIINGKKIHGRSARAKYGSESKFPKGYTHCSSESKHLYVKIMDKDYKLLHAKKVYPKRAGSSDNAASGFQSEEGGAIPTPALQK